MTGARIRRVIVAGELLEQMFRTGVRQPTQILEGLPSGAQFVSGGTLGGDRKLVLLFEHESFDPWHPAGDPAPEQLPAAEISGLREQLQHALELHFGFKVRALVLDEGAELGALLRATNGNGR